MVLVSLVANQGTNASWHESGMYQRRLLNYLGRTKTEWASRDVVWFDTRTLRERLTQQLSSAPNGGWHSVNYFQNSALLRGFTCTSMLRMASPESRVPDGVLDVECGAREANGFFRWHERFNPANTHEVELKKVFRVDCLSDAIEIVP
jgi:hypothetical protein